MMSSKIFLFQVSILVVFVVTPSNARLNVQDSSATINTVCSKTINPSYCQRLLGSIPCAATADLKGLAKITLYLARSSAKQTIDRLHLLITSTADPKLEESYKSCSKHYDTAVVDINDSEADFNKGDYNGMNVQASAAMTEAGDCDDETKGLAVDPPVKKGNEDMDHISRIVLVVSNLL